MDKKRIFCIGYYPWVTICILCLFSIITFSCKDDDIPRLEEKIETLEDDINGLQSIVALQNAHRERKKIVSAGKFQDELGTAENGSVSKSSLYWLITFSDNTTLKMPAFVVKTLVFDDATNICTICLYDDQILVFNSKEMVYPTSLVVLEQEVKFLKNTEAVVEFRVNPANAIFNYDVSSEDCQIEFDMLKKKVNTYASYVTALERCRLTDRKSTRLNSSH